MDLSILKQEEKQMNFIMFIVTVVVPIAGFAFVMLFLQGTIADVSVFSILALSLLVRLFEKNWENMQNIVIHVFLQWEVQLLLL